MKNNLSNVNNRGTVDGYVVHDSIDHVRSELVGLQTRLSTILDQMNVDFDSQAELYMVAIRENITVENIRLYVEKHIKWNLYRDRSYQTNICEQATEFSPEYTNYVERINGNFCWAHQLYYWTFQKIITIPSSQRIINDEKMEEVVMSEHASALSWFDIIYNDDQSDRFYKIDRISNKINYSRSHHSEPMYDIIINQSKLAPTSQHTITEGTKLNTFLITLIGELDIMSDQASITVSADVLSNMKSAEQFVSDSEKKGE